MKQLTIVLFLVIVLTTVTFVTVYSLSPPHSSGIPSWIKNTAKFWVEGNVSDQEFITAIKYLIEQEIIKIEGFEKSDNVVNAIKTAFKTEPKLTLNKNCYGEYDDIIVKGSGFYGKEVTLIHGVISELSYEQALNEESSSSRGFGSVLAQMGHFIVVGQPIVVHPDNGSFETNIGTPHGYFTVIAVENNHFSNYNQVTFVPVSGKYCD